MSEEEFILTQCDEMVGSETDAARRKRKQRNLERLAGEKQAALPPEKHRYNFSTDWWMDMLYQITSRKRWKPGSNTRQSGKSHTRNRA